MNIADLKFIECDQPNIVVSAVKKAEKGEYFVLRIHEERGEQVTAKITLNPEVFGLKEVK